MQCANQGYTLKPNDTLSEATLLRYTSAAVAWFQTHIPHLQNLSIGDPSKTKNLHPIIADTIFTRQRWREPKPKRQPYTDIMFQTLHSLVIQARKENPSTFFGRECSVYDWTRLGIFTGSRGIEYVQTTGTRTRYSTIPDEPSSGAWKNMPLAFIFEDFTLLCEGCPLTREDVAAGTIIPDSLTIRFRFDKSKTNFSIRHYRRTDHPIFNPVAAAQSILQRAIKLQVQPHEPLSYFIQTSGQYKGKKVLLMSTDIINVMRDMCKQSYPESHYMHKNYKLIDCHSNRVTAAVALANAGTVPMSLLIGFDGSLNLLNTIYVNVLELLDPFVHQQLKEPCSFDTIYIYIYIYIFI